MLVILGNNLKNSMDMHLILEQRKITSIVCQSPVNLINNLRENHAILLVIDEITPFIRKVAIILHQLQYQKNIICWVSNTDFIKSISDVFGEYNLNNIEFVTNLLEMPNANLR